METVTLFIGKASPHPAQTTRTARLWRYRSAKEEAWRMLSDVEKKYVCQMLPEAIRKLSNAKHEGLIGEALIGAKPTE